MADYLKGKCIKADKHIVLMNRLVDGKVYSASDFYIPTIYKNNVYLVMHSNESDVTLKNLSSDEWDICEIPLSMVEDFKIVKKESV